MFRDAKLEICIFEGIKIGILHFYRD